MEVSFINGYWNLIIRLNKDIYKVLSLTSSIEEKISIVVDLSFKSCLDSVNNFKFYSKWWMFSN